MHILQVTPYFPPSWSYGGIPRIVDGLSRALTAEGARITVWTTDAGDEQTRLAVSSIRDHNGIRVLTSPNLSNHLAYQHQLFLPRGARQALDQVGAVDLVHLHGHRHLLNNAAVSWARERNIPYLLTANGTLARIERKITLKWLWDLAIAGRIPRDAARCIAVSAADVAQHRRAGIAPDRIVRIPNGLDMGEFSNLPEPGRFRARHGLDDSPLVVYLGRISPRKGVDHLVQAFDGGALDPAQLVVAGNDMGALQAAQERAGSRVHFVGLVHGEHRLELLTDADVLVYPSTDEIFGLVPFEGLLGGAPVVVGHDCGCGELIAEAGAGLLVKYADVDGLRARIQTLLGDPVARDAMVRRGRSYVAAHLAMDRVARQHLDLYEDILGEAKPLAPGFESSS
ncbi:MAG: glycosyltransferase family 4 protein [Myxococcota bacterium]|nr:glycosyltransferase family 4 protein [Myxococcota bacterium]